MMEYPLLTKEWTFPSQHEKEIYSTIVYEIFYDRILILIILTSFFSFLLNQFISGDILQGLIFVILSNVILFVIFFPIFIRPWDIILSNKRLILRHRYWFSGRFTTIKSLFLIQLESEKITPKIKVFSLLLGLAILQSFSVVLIDFGLTLNLPLPLFIGLLFFYGGFLGITDNLQLQITKILEFFFSPFLDFALFFGLISLFLALSLIIFSLPYKNEMKLMTTGGHIIQLKAGFPDELINLVFAVSRKHKVLTKKETKFKWDIPLLDDEDILSYGRVGLIDRRAQFLGLLSLFLILQSAESFYAFIFAINPSNLIIFFIHVLNLIIILFSIIFSKRYSRVIATNHRLLFQEERVNVSGLWGKRIYYYTDLQKKNLQSIYIDRFTGITSTSIIISLLLTLVTLYLFISLKSFEILFFSFVVISLYMLFSYKTFTRLEFFAISGFSHSLNYELPIFIEWIAHKIEENSDWVYNLVFANILTEESIVNLSNDIRDITTPVITLDEYNGETITEELLLGKDEPILNSWEKLGPSPYYKSSIILGLIVSIIAVFLLNPNIKLEYRPIFLIVSFSVIIIFFLRKLTTFYYTLIITDKRIFFVRQILPKSIAKTFGILPEWSLHEIRRDQIQGTQFKYLIPSQFIKKSFINLSGILLIILFLNSYPTLFSIIPSEIFEILIVIFSITLILLINSFVVNLIKIIPRFSLFVFSKYNFIYIPYFKSLDSFSKLLTEKFELFVKNNQITRI